LVGNNLQIWPQVAGWTALAKTADLSSLQHAFFCYVMTSVTAATKPLCFFNRKELKWEVE